MIDLTYLSHAARRWSDLISAGRWVEVERSDGTPHAAADPLWQEIDRGGHIHLYVVAEGALVVRDVIEDQGKLRCIRCGDVVVPGKLPPVAVRRGEWTINGEAVEEAIAHYVLDLLGRDR